eukprot:scaffold80140_cov61-Phaeocystis_antarctica.AAC.3
MQGIMRREAAYRAAGALLAAPLQPAAASPAAPVDAGEPVVSSPASLPVEIFESAERGELQASGWAKVGWSKLLCPD